MLVSATFVLETSRSWLDVGTRFGHRTKQTTMVARQYRLDGVVLRKNLNESTFLVSFLSLIACLGVLISF